MLKWLAGPVAALSHLLANLALRLGGEPAPAAPSALPRARDFWRELRESRYAIQRLTEQAVQDNLQGRKNSPRDQKTDNKLLAPISDTIHSALALGDHRLAAATFATCYEVVLDHEQNVPCEIHKGAPTFDVARAYLQCWDFPAAMHYFELAQHETRETIGDNTFDIYTFDLFGKNFWASVGASLTEHPLSVYAEFWKSPFDQAAAVADWTALSGDSKLSYIIATERRIRYLHLEDHSRWDGSDSLRLGYWSLASDIARLIEVEVKRLAVPPADTLLAALLQKFHNTPFGDLSADIDTFHQTTYQIRNATPNQAITNYETHFDTILSIIRDNSRPDRERIAHALYLLGVTRNQVAHRLDKSTKLFKQLEDAKFVCDVFLSLCHIDGWKNV